MGKSKLLALVMCIAILMPVFTSCSAKSGGHKVVKADDPWFDSLRFKLEKDYKENDDVMSSCISTSDDRVFNIYCKSDDKWATSTTLLDTYDYEGNLVKRQNVKCPEINGSRLMNIYSFDTDPQGKNISVIAYLNSEGLHGPVFADIDPETGVVSNIKEVFSKKAERARKPDTALFGLQNAGDYTVAVLMYGPGGKPEYQLLLFRNKEYLCELDLSVVHLVYLMEGFSVDESQNSLYISGSVIGDTLNLEFDLNTGRLKSQKSILDMDNDSVNYGEYIPTDNGKLCKIDSLGNIVMLDANTMTPKTVVDTNWYTPYFNFPFDGKYSVESTVLNCTEDKIVIRDSETVTYGSLKYFNTEYVRVLKKADKNPHAGKKIIELALPLDSGVTDYLANAIFEFNKTDDEYIIRTWDKYKTGFVVGRSAMGTSDENEQKIYKMIQDLKGDEAPDLAIGIQKNYAMRDDVFMDLSDFLDPEVLDKQYKNIIDAVRINGKLYFLPVTLEIEGLVAKSDMLKDGAAGITFDEYDEMIKEYMFGFSPYDYPGSEVYNKRGFFLSCIDTKSAIEGDKIEFGTDQFRAAAEYAKEHFKYDDLDSTPLEYISDFGRYRGRCYYAKIGDYLDYVHDCYTGKDKYIIIGTPSVDGSGPRFMALETISVSASTDVKEGCRKFINYLFAGTAFNSGECNFRHIVTNKEIMDKNIGTLSKHNNDAYAWYEKEVESGAFIPAAGLDKATGDKYATDDMREIFLNSLSTITTYYYEDYSIIKFLDEELAPYYAGDRSLDDAIKYVNDRTAKYVREM